MSSLVVTLGPQGTVMEQNALSANNYALPENLANLCEEMCPLFALMGPSFDPYVSFCSETLCKVPADACMDKCKGTVKDEITCIQMCSTIEGVNQAEDSFNVAFDFLNNVDIRDENGDKIDFSDPEAVSIEKIGNYLDQILDKVFTKEGIQVIGDIFGLTEENMNKIRDNEGKIKDIKHCLGTCHHFDTEEKWIQCGNECSESLGTKSIGMEKESRDGNSAGSSAGLVSGVVVVASAVVATLF